MPTRSAKADWRGTIQEGRGYVHFGDFSEPYNFAGRVGDDRIGTNAEELIAAAQASCYTMSLAARLSNNAAYTIERIDTQCKTTLSSSGVGLKISRLEIHTRAKITGITNEEFQEYARTAHELCPVSNALAAVTIVLKAELID